MEQKLTTLIQQKWLSKMLGFDYMIENKKGKDNLVANALSRLNEGDPKCAAICQVIPTWKQEIKNSWETNEEVQDLKIQLIVDPQSVIDFTLIE